MGFEPLHVEAGRPPGGHRALWRTPAAEPERRRRLPADPRGRTGRGRRGASRDGGVPDWTPAPPAYRPRLAQSMPAAHRTLRRDVTATTGRGCHAAPRRDPFSITVAFSEAGDRRRAPRFSDRCGPHAGAGSAADRCAGASPCCWWFAGGWRTDTSGRADTIARKGRTRRPPPPLDSEARGTSSPPIHPRRPGGGQPARRLGRVPPATVFGLRRFAD